MTDPMTITSPITATVTATTIGQRWWRVGGSGGTGGAGAVGASENGLVIALQVPLRVLAGSAQGNA
jgi:hypothetical protein